MKTIAVIGATGAVGRKIISLLEKRRFPLQNLRCFASEKSVGNTIDFQNQSIPIESLSHLENVDLAFFAAGSTVSKEWIPKLKTTLCIDSSSYFRMQKNVPLIIPEINLHAIKNHEGVIASPNCTATILLMPLAPLHRKYRAKRIVMSTYQAASGGGAKLQEILRQETISYLQGDKNPTFLPFPYAFNLYPHNSKLLENGYVEEEMKVLEESRKILEDETLQISATCVRVPVFQAHSVSANIEFHHPICLTESKDLIASAPGVKWFSDHLNNRFATPLDATDQNDVLCGRLRLDPSLANTLEFWSVGDQLLKGAALNAVQIAEALS